MNNETATPQDEIRDKVRTLLQEHQQEAYIPEEYLAGLKDLLADNPLPQIDKQELDRLLDSLSSSSLESRSSEIIMQLVVTNPGGDDSQELIQNLADMCGYFLETGDYEQVLKILRQAADPRLAVDLRVAMRDAFCCREFLDEILSGLTIWGKPKYDQVALLIQIIGRPFIPALLEHLANEENMSLRRFMMDRVLAFGDAARPALVAQLEDPRWYVLRNVIAMLRTLAPGQEVDRLRPLLRNSNQKVRIEVLRSLLLAGDPIAQRQVLRDLDSNDQETRLTAISLIDRNGTLDMAHKLASLLNNGGYNSAECDLKSACIQALAELARPEILPDLDKLLGSRSLLSSKPLQRLKLEVIKSLERYPAEKALPILESIASGTDELSVQATESIKTLRSRLS